MFENVIIHLVTHPSHVGWQLSHLSAVTRCNVTSTSQLHNPFLGTLCWRLLYTKAGWEEQIRVGELHTHKGERRDWRWPWQSNYIFKLSQAKGHGEKQAETERPGMSQRLIWAYILLMSTGGSELKHLLKHLCLSTDSVEILGCSTTSLPLMPV